MKTKDQPRLSLAPVRLKEAHEFVYRHHRHHDPAQGGIFAIGVSDQNGTLRGVAVVGRPNARKSQDGWTAEVTRVATDGCPNACSFLYGAARRAARAMGYRRILTKILATEPGTSLTAAGWQMLRDEQGKPIVSKGGSWSRTNRTRRDHHPLQPKLTWEVP